MRIGVIQSNYVPWRGYFDLINKVDLFIFYDDVQYTKNDWRNRNKIKTSEGLRWLTVPVRIKSLSQRICDSEIVHSQKWQKSHTEQIYRWYRQSPFFTEYFEEFRQILYLPHATISQLNQDLILWAMQKLQISTPVRSSSDFELPDGRNARLLSLLKQVGATSYLSGPSARSYLDQDLFQSEGIAVEYIQYEYPPYPQPYGEFQGQVSVLDLLFCCGRESHRYLGR
jgi:hypothetical protein